MGNIVVKRISTIQGNIKHPLEQLCHIRIQLHVNKQMRKKICEGTAGLIAKVKRLKTSTAADRHC